MTNGHSDGHLSAEALQALLEGEVSDLERARSEEHLAFCARCAAEIDAWGALIDDLGRLPSLSPDVAFAERVMTRLRAPNSVPFAARTPTSADHVSDTVLQDYLDGALGHRKQVAVDAHLAACGSCSAEVDSWATVFAKMEDLPSFSPTDGFARRVLARVEVPERVPLLAAVRNKLAALMPASAEAHLDSGRLQDYLEGDLPRRQAARVRTHLDGCQGCAAELGAWQGVLSRLETLERYEPRAAFAERVMAGLEIRVPVRAAGRAPTWSRALARARRLVPRTRRAWAAISGVAVTPAVVSGLVLYAVFSHPTVTVGSLTSFLAWQMADLGAAGWATLSAAALQSAEPLGIYSIFGTLASAPLAVAGGVLAYSLVSAMALRVLYKNIFANRPADGRYAYVSTS